MSLEIGKCAIILGRSVIALFLSREEPPTSIVDVSVPESTDLPVKTEQLDPLGKSLSEWWIQGGQRGAWERGC